MAKYKCPKCGMEYDKPGKCTMDGTKLVKVGDEESPAPSHQKMANEDHSHHHELMVQDFKKRFFVSLALTFPVLILSPLIQQVLGFSLEFPGDSYLLFALSAVIFFYGGLPFLKGIVSETKDRKPGMMTLIAVAITSAFVYSSIVVFGLKGEVFFWELVTLIDIMLLGHLIEMRSVMGASRALEQLVRLLPAVVHVVGEKETVIDVPL